MSKDVFCIFRSLVQQCLLDPGEGSRDLSEELGDLCEVVVREGIVPDREAKIYLSCVDHDGDFSVGYPLESLEQAEGR